MTPSQSFLTIPSSPFIQVLELEYAVLFESVVAPVLQISANCTIGVFCILKISYAYTMMIKNGPEPLYFTNSAAEIQGVVQSPCFPVDTLHWADASDPGLSVPKFIKSLVGMTWSWKSPLLPFALAVSVCIWEMAPIGIARTAAVAWFAKERVQLTISHVNGTIRIPTRKGHNFFLNAYSASPPPKICITAI